MKINIIWFVGKYTLVWAGNSFLIKFHPIWTHRLPALLINSVSSCCCYCWQREIYSIFIFLQGFLLSFVVYVDGCVNYKHTVHTVCTHAWKQSEKKIYATQLLMDTQYVIMFRFLCDGISSFSMFSECQRGKLFEKMF